MTKTTHNIIQAIKFIAAIVVLYYVGKLVSGNIL